MIWMPLEGIRATSRVTLVIVGPADILPLWIGWEGHELHVSAYFTLRW